MKILLLSRYSYLGASSRLRAFQYIPFLASQGIEITISPLVGDEYIKNIYTAGKKRWRSIFSGYLRRIVALIKYHQFDLLWIEKELFPFVPAFAEVLFNVLKVPYIVDYDDAIYHNYDMSCNPFTRTIHGRKIAVVMRHAAGVIVGNEYLASYARQAEAKRLELIPTAIDLDRYQIKQHSDNAIFTIGWIGSPFTSKYLSQIQPALSSLCNDKKTQLSVIGSHIVTAKDIPTRLRMWSEETEVQDIQEFDVGVMPLPDKPWERGKCGYKLIQYMACCLPVVASAVGVNKEIVDHGNNGYLAATTEEWIKAITMLRNDRELRIRMGIAGRRKVENKYCIQQTAPQLLAFLQRILKERY